MINKQTISNLKKLKSFHSGSYGADIDRAIKALEQEPQNKGQWIDDSRTLPLSDAVKHCVRCSNCGTHWDYATRYCPYCGSKMEDVK